MSNIFEVAMDVLCLSKRPEQMNYASVVDAALSKADSKINLLQAETGVGKSLGYSIPVLNFLAKNSGSRVIIASNTISLLRQLNDKDLPMAKTAVSEITGKQFTHSLLLGRQNYISSERLELALDQKRDKDKDQCISEIENLRRWTATIDEYINEYSELPLGLKAEQICQKPYSIDKEREALRQAALSSDVLITTHAMLITDLQLSGAILFNGENENKKTALIIDEADLFYSSLQSRQQNRLNLFDLRSQVKDLVKPSVINIINNKCDEICSVANASSFLTSSEISAESRRFLNEISRKLKKNKASDKLLAIAQEIDSLVYSNGVTDIGVGVSAKLAEPAIVFVNPYITRVFGWYASKFYKSTILTSGTLSTLDNSIRGVQWLLDDFKITPERLGLVEFFSPVKFGSIDIVLAGPLWPRVFVDADDVKYNQDWLDSTSEYIQSLTGNALVLASSHQEVSLLSKLISTENIVVHSRNERLSEAVRRYKKVGGILITASGGVGLDIRNDDGSQMLNHVVLTRIPFAPRNENQENELASYICLLSTQDKASAHAFVRNIAFRNNLYSTIRQIKQSLGRGIRHETDHFTFHVLDPRFPKANELSSTLAALRWAIPARFKSEYANAKILKDKQAEILVW